MRHFISVDQLTTGEIYNLLQTAEEFRKNKYQVNEQVFGANLFFEPSTRTKMSFVVAEKKLGIESLDFNAKNSAVLKGESLYDTAKTFEAIGANFLVIRHESDIGMKHLKESSPFQSLMQGLGRKNILHKQCLIY